MKTKRIFVVMLALLLVVACSFAMFACNKNNSSDEPTPAKGEHNFDFSSATYNGEPDYFKMVECQDEDCHEVSRRESEREFDNVFTFTYDAARQAQIDEHVATLNNILNPENANFVGAYDDNPDWRNTDTYDTESGEWIHNNQEQYDANKAFEAEYYDPFYDDLEYVTEQYQICYVHYCVNDNDEWSVKYEDISNERTDLISEYYGLFRKVYNTKFREYFFSEEDGWTEEDIEKALIMSDSYGSDEYKDINSSISEIEVSFRDLKSSVVTDTSGKNKNVVPNMYAEYVSYKNQLAQLAGYENYVEYAYVNEYDRDYSPAEVAQLRAYAKQYMKPIFTKIFNGYQSSSQTSFKGQAKLYYDALSSGSIFTSKLTSDIVGDYLKGLNFEGAQGTVDYYKNASDLFEVGNVYSGNYTGAFNYWIGAQEKSVLYFGPDSYSGAFTFVHEFGHYNNSFYNQGASMSYDLDETHSQGNEMMFLAYLSTVLADYESVYEKLEYDNLFNMVAISLLAMAVDEFEQAIYTNTYVGEKYEDGIVAGEYDDLFYDILKAYGLANILNEAYWRYVVIESPCYYISYSTSAMASLQLYAMAMNEIKETGDMTATREKYYKLITFTDDENNAHTDFVGDTVVDIGFGDTLKYAGLYSPFEEDFYIFLKSFFNPDK